MYQLLSFDVDGRRDEKVLVKLPKEYNQIYFDLLARLSVLDGDLVDSFEPILNAVKEVPGYLTSRWGDCYGFLSVINTFEDTRGEQLAKDLGMDVYTEKLFVDLYGVIKAEIALKGCIHDLIYSDIDTYDEDISQLIATLAELALQGHEYSHAWFYSGEI